MRLRPRPLLRSLDDSLPARHRRAGGFLADVRGYHRVDVSDNRGVLAFVPDALADHPPNVHISLLPPAEPTKTRPGWRFAKRRKKVASPKTFRQQAPGSCGC